MLGADKEEFFLPVRFSIDYAQIVISAGGAFSQGACESAACEGGPRDRANAKVLGMRRAGEEEEDEKRLRQAAPMEVMEVP
jgi:hypothetical protein